ncbi:hypothetical protein D3C76_1484320 [compost metagenome]
MIQIAHRLALGGQGRGMLLGVGAWRKAVISAILHFVQQALDQVPVVAAHGGWLLL